MAEPPARSLLGASLALLVRLVAALDRIDRGGPGIPLAERVVLLEQCVDVLERVRAALPPGHYAGPLVADIAVHVRDVVARLAGAVAAGAAVPAGGASSRPRK